MTGFYETFRTSGGRPHHWDYNLARLRRACAAAEVTLPGDSLALDPARLAAVVREMLERRGTKEAVFRYSVRLSGAGGGSVAEELVPRDVPAPAPERGVALRVLAVVRDPSRLRPRPKQLDDPDVRAANGELGARTKEPADEGLFLARSEGWVVETVRQNLLWFVGDQVFTPAAETGAVAGTCRAWLAEKVLNVEPVCAPLEVLRGADAVAVCNSVRGITPVRELWDVADRAVLRTYESAAHPAIVKSARAWQAALAQTASVP